jgi:predicted membrane channel-forming protein YqfA (hemolysin III family)
MVTSSLFTIPIYYGIMKRKYELSAVTSVAMVCSVIYWYKPEEGSYKTADLIMSKVSGFIYFAYGLYNIHNHFGRMIGYSNMTLMLNCYQASCTLYNLNNPYWVYYHMAFHLFTILGKMFVIGISN